MLPARRNGVRPARRSLDAGASSMFATEPTRRGAAGYPESHLRKATAMLYTIVVILLVLWALGLVTSYTMGGFIHILLVVALIVLVVNFLSGRKV